MDGLDRPPWSPARQCTATNRSGERCQRQPIPGGEVCVMHGGRAPQVQQSAKARLLAGADLAIDYLLNLLAPRPPCPACGRSDADRDPVVVRACQLVLDRAGFHPSLTVEHVPAPNPYEDMPLDELIERTEKMLGELRDMRDAERAQLDAGVIDAVTDGYLVPEEDDDAPVETPEPVADDPNPLEFGTPEERTDVK